MAIKDNKGKVIKLIKSIKNTDDFNILQNISFELKNDKEILEIRDKFIELL